MSDKKQDVPEKPAATSSSSEESGGLDRRGFLGVVGGLSVGALMGGGEVAALVAGGDRKPGGLAATPWGPRVDLTGLKQNYAPQQVKAFTVPPGGIDNLGLHSVDVFSIPGLGEFTVEFKGYFQVARSNPTTYDWATSDIRVNIIDFNLVGRHELIGEIHVRLNPDIVSSGQLLSKTSPAKTGDPVVTEPAKDCRIATSVEFEVVGTSKGLGSGLGVLFNKEPILLMNEHVTRIPPVDDPNGHALLFKLPLFSRNDPEGEPIAYLTSLRYGADNYLTEVEAKAIRERRPRAEGKAG